MIIAYNYSLSTDAYNSTKASTCLSRAYGKVAFRVPTEIALRIAADNESPSPSRKKQMPLSILFAGMSLATTGMPEASISSNEYERPSYSDGRTPASKARRKRYRFGWTPCRTTRPTSPLAVINDSSSRLIGPSPNMCRVAFSEMSFHAVISCGSPFCGSRRHGATTAFSSGNSLSAVTRGAFALPL